MSRSISKAKGRLTSQVTAASTTISFQASDSNRALTSVAMADFGTYGYLVLNPSGKADNYEIVRFTSWSVSSSTITVGGLTRGLELEGDDTGGTGKSFAAGTTVIISDNHHWLNNVVRTEDAQTIAGVKTFSSLPATTAGDPVTDNDLARKSYVDATATGSATTDELVVAGTAGETIAAGNLVYFDAVTNNEWMLADADTAAKAENVLLGIARGAGTNGNAISNGILLLGLDTNQSGMTAGDVMYASDTAGSISATPGTKEVTVGIAKSATDLYFNPRYNQQITEDEQDALAGTSGTPSSSNKYVTNDDTSATGSAGKVVRGNGSGEIDNSWIPNKFGGDGSDGALDTSGGVVDVDLGAANYVVKNYTTINVATNNLTFSNPAASGTTVVLRSQGNVTISASIVGSSIGAAGATGGLIDADGSAGTDSFAILDDAGHTAGKGNGANGATAGAASSGGTVWTNSYLYTDASGKLNTRTILIAPGSGGGSGGGAGGAGAGVGGASGRGGGAILIECGGALNFSGTITVAGGNGTNGTNAAALSNEAGGGGGGGGSAGQVVLLYNTLTANNGTITKTGGNGGNGGNGYTNAGTDKGGGGGGAGGSNFNTAGGDGGAGGAGATGANGSNGSTPSGGGTGGTGGTGVAPGIAGSGGGGGGGGGAIGTSVVAQNYWFF